MLYRALLMLCLLLPLAGWGQGVTTLEVSFTDGRGKFYKSEPELHLLDTASGKVLAKFYRTVDSSGNPKPQIVPPGVYDLIMTGRGKELMRNLVIDAGKKNKVTIKVNNGRLRFRYADEKGNTLKRPVEEFEAWVNIRFEPSPTVRQACTQELEYPPGNYYIEVNTLPVSRFNVDVDFGAITQISIPEPGTVKFNGLPGAFDLYMPRGDSMVKFSDFVLVSNTVGRPYQMKPGTYEARRPATSTNKAATTRFRVYANKTTEVAVK